MTEPMKSLSRAFRVSSLPLLIALAVATPAQAQNVEPLPDPSSTAPAVEAPAPKYIDLDDPWIYRGSDIPRDELWKFGEMPNGLRYAVRENGVPPDQVAIRIRIDAGALHERDEERGFAHLVEHLLFRESKYLAEGQAIPTWQRLGASFGSDTNAQTSATHTVYQLDLPNIDKAKLRESFKILSGMIREPALSESNLAAEVPIVLAERREYAGAQYRAYEASQKTIYAGQRLADRQTIGTVETLQGATSEAVKAFHRRWYRPEKTTIAVAGDIDDQFLASLVEEFFGDWSVAGPSEPAPDFGDPVAPAGADPANPIGEITTLVEPDLPRSITWAVLRPWRQVTDTIEYNRGKIISMVAWSILNRRLEARARAGGSYLAAQVQSQSESRSANLTEVYVVPLGDDWQAAVRDVRGVIADAIATPPTQEEIDREVAEFDIAYANAVEQADIQAGSKLADEIVQAVDIRETVASPEAIMQIFREMKPRCGPNEVHQSTINLFKGDVVRAVMISPTEDAAQTPALRLALAEPVSADPNARIAAKSVNFAELPAIGAPGTIERRGTIGILGMERVDFANGVRALVWETDNEPGRATVKVRFGGGFRSIAPENYPYVTLGEIALMDAGIGELGREELDRLATGRKFGLEFQVGDGAFIFEADTRREDVDDQLYLFAAKLAMPRWDENPVLRAKAGARLTYDSYAATPTGIVNRDLDYMLRARDKRFKTPDGDAIATTSVEGFREFWEPLLEQGPIEVLVFGDVDQPKVIETLTKTFGALKPRTPLSEQVAASGYRFPEASDKPELVYHRGEADQSAAIVAWPTGGGTAQISESRQLEILTQVFSNRILDSLREAAGASYAPQVFSSWPVDVDSGGQIIAFAQIAPENVPAFFAAAEEISLDLAANGPTADELSRVTEPLRQGITRALTGHKFWLSNLEGVTQKPERAAQLRLLLRDYTETTPERIKALAQKYLASRKGHQIAILPEGAELATVAPLPARQAVSGR